MADLTDKTLHSVLKLPRHHGHFFNWYDNLTLQPIEPPFISTVDNGNLAASLWSLKQGAIDDAVQPIIRSGLHSGLRMQLNLLRSIGRSAAMISPNCPASLRRLKPGWLACCVCPNRFLSERSGNSRNLNRPCGGSAK